MTNFLSKILNDSLDTLLLIVALIYLMIPLVPGKILAVNYLISYGIEHVPNVIWHLKYNKDSQKYGRLRKRWQNHGT